MSDRMRTLITVLVGVATGLVIALLLVTLIERFDVRVTALETGVVLPLQIQRAAFQHFRVTAYCPCKKCCGKWADGMTASGTRADHSLVAAPPEFEFGTKIRIPGYAGGKWVRVEDRGGSIKGARLDVLFPTHEEALEWGVRYLDVEVMK